MTQELVDELVQLFKLGTTIQKLHESFGFTRAKIANALRDELGNEAYDTYKRNAIKQIQLTQEQTQQMCDAFKTGSSIKDLMFMWKLGRNTITHILRKEFGDDYKQYALAIIASCGKKSAAKNRGKTHVCTPEWREKLRLSNIGKKHSEETKSKLRELSATRIERGTWSYERVKITTAKATETRRRNGTLYNGVNAMKKWREENGGPMKGRKMSDESRQLMKEAKKRFYARGGKVWIAGRKHTEETKMKCSEGTKRMWITGKFDKGKGCWRSKLETLIYSTFSQFINDVQHSWRLSTPERTYVYDICIPSHRLLIEVNGDYWHMNPTLYAPDFVGAQGILAKEKWELDACKADMASKAGYNVITLWESDIKSQGVDAIVKNVIDKHISTPPE